jgi:hypothetical protein
MGARCCDVVKFFEWQARSNRAVAVLLVNSAHDRREQTFER